MYILNYAKYIMQDRPNENFGDDVNNKDEIVKIVDNVNMKSLSVNVINLGLSLNQWLGGTSKSFQNKNMILSGLNKEKLLMLLKFQLVMMK